MLVLKSSSADHVPTVRRAAQYLRMSTDHQRYSIENQKEMISEYAFSHGIKVVQTYADIGRSGLKLRGRDALLMLIGIWIRMDIFVLLSACIFAGFFVVIELLNTAIERLADTVDDCEKTHRGGHYHHGIKLTKDVAAAAALIALLLYIALITLTFLPYVLYYFRPTA